jgi:hypothetical protein
MKKIIFCIFIFLAIDKIFAQKTIENIIGGWTCTKSMEGFYFDPELRPRKSEINSKKYYLLPGSIIIEKINAVNFQIWTNGGFDNITKYYFENGMLILDLENNRANTKGILGIIFISDDIIYFTLLSGTTNTPFDFLGNNNLYIRAPTVE